MDEAEFCERLGLIREGKLVAVGTTEELKKRVSSGRIEDVFCWKRWCHHESYWCNHSYYSPIFRDKRSLAMMFGAPMLLLWLLSLVFTQKTIYRKLLLLICPLK